MRRPLLIASLVASFAGLPVGATEGVELSAKAKSVAVASAVPPAKQTEAPFTRGGRDPMPELLLRDEQERRGPNGACETTATALCYDLTDGRIVYRQARAYMPKMDGLRAESISLRRDKLVFKYSFK
jgi:hypothetical protein